MSDSFLLALMVLTAVSIGLIVIPLFLPTGRRERGIIYAAELVVFLLGWLKIRNANLLLLGRTFWGPGQVSYLRGFLLIGAGATALLLLCQFIPYKESSDTPDDQPGSRSATLGL